MELGSAVKLRTVEELAEVLRKSPAQIRWMIHNGTAPRSAKIGGRRMFREQDIIDYVNAAFEAEGVA
ncbi:helix-turn-helix domain-containing protein [Arthrobacter agilis]|uniref:helix-turn-helix domain-containing protein n=1 Tax=Arthrobacter agilis TaxID=37921 RepID=UPI002366EB22|nr:helix-turn-helix domain-containing protein [Arthrobacter agilis]WDF34568.1 helix-turn-helix domain-containing protein [Arthrobacter agilis]